ncbi:hypothetical protein B857_03523 [Solibacillus isronensis B3W22]|uniref:Uncharacterized protein n=1 Tax=Solibacillus isronensis B3W22 TaxID=1224748 RepID=K1KHX1_9BACL|nr:hypothetical protein [Solibacillus isronensis]AMO85106.1 hypothetical protein SOLI23_05760 [Solibacillus silvestris]EKB43685.1 hypothetical protein B857_03523 [Solibacillus isronensis B3W22]
MHTCSQSSLQNSLNTELQLIESSLTLSIKQFQTYYSNKQFDEAFAQLQFILATIERSGNPEHVTEALVCCVKFASIVAIIPQSDMLINSIIHSIDSDSSPQNLSMCYYLLSILALEKSNNPEAVQYAKSAYFYALEMKEDRLFYECNAQLQLVTTLLEVGSFEEAKNYIGQFNWYIEQCKNDAEVVFVHSIQASTNFLKQNYEMAVFSMSSLLKKFNESNEIMYTSFLSRHFYRIIKKHPDSNDLYSDLLTFCKEIIERHNSFMASEINKPQSVLIYNSKQFYKLANTFFSEHSDENNLISMYKFKLKNHMTFRKLFEVMNIGTANSQLIIYPYCEQKFLLITTGKYKEVLSNSLHFKNSVVYIGSAENTEHKSFYELYNELNLTIVSHSL